MKFTGMARTFLAFIVATATATACTAQAATPVQRATSTTAAAVVAPSQPVLVVAEHPTTVTFQVVDGKVTSGEHAVEVTAGSKVTVAVTDDHADILHIHGYDKEVPVAAGKPAAVTFTADITGVFDVELHGSDVMLCQLTVRP